MNNNTKQYLNPFEQKVIARLSYEKVDIITKEQFEKYFDFPKSITEKTLFRLKKKGIITLIKRGVYYFSPLESGPGGRRINEFLIPPVLFPKGDYYVGYSNMYNYYGFTDQIFQTIYILNTSLQREKNIGGTVFKMIKISKERMYGLVKIRIKNTDVTVSDKERTIIDMFYFSSSVGGLRKVFEITSTQVESDNVDIKKLVKYAAKFSNIAVRKRIGFVLELAGISDKFLKPLVMSVNQTSLISLYPSESRRGKINKRWKVIENVA